MLTNLNPGRLVKSFNLGVSPFPTTVPGDTLLAVPPVNKTAMEGEMVNFDCVAKGEGTVVTWSREGTSILEIQVKTFRLFFTRRASMRQKFSNLLCHGRLSEDERLSTATGR